MQIAPVGLRKAFADILGLPDVTITSISYLELSMTDIINDEIILRTSRMVGDRRGFISKLEDRTHIHSA